MQEVLYDPQTSGGLLFAVKPEEAQRFVSELRAEGSPAAVVGRFVAKREKNIYVR